MISKVFIPLRIGFIISLTFILASIFYNYFLLLTNSHFTEIQYIEIFRIFRCHILICLQMLAFIFYIVYYEEKEMMMMANTSAIYARIDTRLKENAETILSQLGISPSSAIQMLYSQIVLQRGLPFAPRLPGAFPTAIGGMSRAELDDELQKGMDSLRTGEVQPAEQVFHALKKELDV